MTSISDMRDKLLNSHLKNDLLELQEQFNRDDRDIVKHYELKLYILREQEIRSRHDLVVTLDKQIVELYEELDTETEDE